MTVIIISALSSIFSGLVLFFVKNFFKKKKKRESERSITSAKENILILKSIDAIGKLTYANTIAIRDGKVNGEITDSLQAYNEVKEEMYDYLLEQNARR